MADGLKQRLIGGAALLVIGVISWFWLLSADSPVDPVARATQIPPAPDIQPFTVPEPAPREAVAPIEQPPAPVAQTVTPRPTTQASVREPAPARVEKPSTVAKPQIQPKPETTTVVKPTEPRPAPEAFALDTQGLPVAWVVQVGAFSSQANADKVKAELQQKGFKAYTQAVKTPKPAFKVMVGPKLSRERADAQKKAIDAALNSKTMVVRFTPN